jgi:hypothetical protein
MCVCPLQGRGVRVDYGGAREGHLRLRQTATHTVSQAIEISTTCRQSPSCIVLVSVQIDGGRLPQVRPGRWLEFSYSRASRISLQVTLRGSAPRARDRARPRAAARVESGGGVGATEAGDEKRVMVGGRFVVVGPGVAAVEAGAAGIKCRVPQPRRPSFES